MNGFNEYTLEENHASIYEKWIIFVPILTSCLLSVCLFDTYVFVYNTLLVLALLWIYNVYVSLSYQTYYHLLCKAMTRSFLHAAEKLLFGLHTFTVYPKKYAHGFCFAVLCCGYRLTDFPISIRLTSLALWQSNDCPSASKATLMNMDKYFMWIHYERLHNQNKAKHNKTVCIFLGIYCMLQMCAWLISSYTSINKLATNEW